MRLNLRMQTNKTAHTLVQTTKYDRICVSGILVLWLL